MKQIGQIFLLTILSIFFLVGCDTTIEDSKEFNVVFNTDGGTNLSSLKVQDRTKITKPLDPSKEGFIFIAWYKDSNFNAEWKFDLDIVTSNITLYAKYEVNDGRLTITGITFDDASFTYDGNEKQILIQGTVPEGVNIAYSNNKGTNTGTYQAQVVLSGDNYHTKTMNAVLTISKATISNIAFTNQSHTFDTEEKTVLITGTPPPGVTVAYTNNKGTNAGTYNSGVVLSGDNYHSLTLQAVLTIQKAVLTGIKFDDTSFDFDATEKSILITGVLPTGTSVEYSNNKQTEVGTYDTVAIINGGTNYESFELTAKLTIKSSEEELFSYINGNTVYFQNNLDKNRLYQYNNATSTLSKVNSDQAKYFTSLNGEIYYLSSSLFANSIAKLRSDNAKVNIYNRGAQYLVSDGTYLYYAVNPIIGSYGIYRLSLTGEEPIETLVANVKAKYLVVDSTHIYFSNMSDGGKLYKVSKTEENGTSIKIYDEKIEYLIIDNGALYFKQNKLLNDSICSIKIDGSDFVKLSNDNGKYLVKSGNYIYYSNVDLLTSNIYGKGIYKLNISTGLSTKVLNDESVAVSSLNTDGTYLYYYRVDNKSFYRLNLSTGTEVNLMANFTPSEPILNGMSGTTAVYNHYVYFQNFYDGHKLYRYDTITERIDRITSTEVDEILISGDYLYYRAISYYVNKNVYRINLKTGGEPQLLTKDDGAEFEIYDGKMYYVNFTGTNTINRMNLDGTENEILITKQATNLRVYSGKLYFIVDSKLSVMNLDGTEFTVLSTNTALGFEIQNDIIYYRRKGTIFTGNKLASISITGTNATDLINADPKSINIIGSKIYYYNDQITNWGIFVYDIIANTTTKLSGTVAENIVILGDKIYYYKSSSGDFYNGDGHFYRIDLDGTNDTMIY